MRVARGRQNHRSRWLQPMVLLGLSFCLGACAIVQAHRPEDFSVRYSFYSSAPPPGFYRARLEVSANGDESIEFVTFSGRIERTRRLDATQLDRLYEDLAKAGAFDLRKDSRPYPEPVGGGIEGLTITAKGKKYEIPAGSSDSKTALRIVAIRKIAEEQVPPDQISKLLKEANRE